MPTINWLRIVRLIIGISFLGEAIASKQWLFLFPGIILTYQGIVNTGCSSGACEIDPTADNKQDKALN